jgi:hypothetical protein
MSNSLVVDLFAEDRGHEEWLRPLVERVSREQGKPVDIRVRSARGGHGRALTELEIYQKGIVKGIGGKLPDLLIAAIDGNCASFVDAQNAVTSSLLDEFTDRTIIATPDPHVERWYMADLQTFHNVVGVTPSLKQQKCERDYYKNLLSQAVVNAGHPATLGGIEFARELVDGMSYYRAGRADSSLKHFIEKLSAWFKS